MNTVTSATFYWLNETRAYLEGRNRGPSCEASSGVGSCVLKPLQVENLPWDPGGFGAGGESGLCHLHHMTSTSGFRMPGPIVIIFQREKRERSLVKMLFRICIYHFCSCPFGWLTSPCSCKGVWEIQVLAISHVPATSQWGPVTKWKQKRNIRDNGIL